jgi:Trk K+ transport system NAD-binding subunit
VKKGKKLVTRIRLAIRQNRAAALFVLIWIVGGALLFSRALRMSPHDALLTAMCLAKAAGGWAAVYQSFTEVVVFGAIASVVVTNVTRKYRPEATARALAEDARDHVVVVGWTHLGERVRDLAIESGCAVVVVEADAAKVAALVRDEEPLVIGNARERSVLEAAQVAAAKVVVLATDDLEVAAVACRLVRELNESCELVVRCPDEDVGAVLAKTYRARALSTSRLAAEFIRGHAVKSRAKTALVLGDNNLSARVVEALAEKRIVATTTGTGVDVDLVVLCDDDLGKNLLTVDRIRDVNRRVKIICRAFHDDAAEILVRDPFACTVLSTSRHAAESLVRSGVFREVGVVEAQAWTTSASSSSSA